MPLHSNTVFDDAAKFHCPRQTPFEVAAIDGHTQPERFAKDGEGVWKA